MSKRFPKRWRNAETPEEIHPVAGQRADLQPGDEVMFRTIGGAFRGKWLRRYDEHNDIVILTPGGEEVPVDSATVLKIQEDIDIKTKRTLIWIAIGSCALASLIMWLAGVL
jgi:hypothetical protein